MGFLTSIKSGDHSPVEGKVGSFFLSQSHLVGGFNPFEKYARQNGFIFPNFRAENKKYLSCHHLAMIFSNDRVVEGSSHAIPSRYRDLPRGGSI